MLPRGTLPIVDGAGNGGRRLFTVDTAAYLEVSTDRSTQRFDLRMLPCFLPCTRSRFIPPGVTESINQSILMIPTSHHPSWTACASRASSQTRRAG
jgi:hypothetical protein